MVEVDMDELDERSVVQKGLRRVDKADGGLSRKRWEESEIAAEKQRDVNLRGRRNALPSYADGASSGYETSGLRDENDESLNGQAESTIYVSILDPINKPSFKPSPTKPIPRWMQPYSIHVNTNPGPDYIDGLLSPLDRHLEPQRQLKSRASYQSSYASTICPTTPPPSMTQGHQEPETDSPRDSIPSEEPLHHVRMEILHRGASYVSNEPLTLPSSHLVVSSNANLSSSTFSTYLTPPEYPSPTPSIGRRTPQSFSEIDYDKPKTSAAPATITPSRSQGVRPTRGPLRDQGSQNPLWRLGKSSPQTHRVSSQALPLASSEYLERYQPGRASSIAVPSATVRDQIVAKLRRNSRAEPNTGQVTEETELADSRPRRPRGESMGPGTGTGEVRGINNNKRRSVHAELRRLFGR
ncbi:hypothetical protein B0H67DRAFT_583619 [Lasiosphaeris hirsuta]|uniref:Uncharacterized protein n=1 Tax=Lasiosphaeris hirsuta TaxID=260670 RepID=A0AA40A7Z9_9PEZI|nr:hypothetical protein B0H67DRAFT_583619 [Lasiosphaeris hirsuta]